MLRQLTVLVLALASIVPTVRAAGPELKYDDDKTMYALGVALSQNLENFSLSEQELELVKLGLTDGVLKRDKKVPDVESYGPKLQQLARTRMANVAAAEKKAAQPFLEKAAAEKGAQRTASGLVYSELKAGTGDMPKPTDVVKVNYEGRLMDGTVFDGSRGTPASFPLNGVIKCWSEGLQKMKVGGKAKLVCPAEIAYGDNGSPPLIKPGAPLVFEVELLEIVKK
jgi:FKBP-type peptidyl-prolyl cis-trans isomerase FkpA